MAKAISDFVTSKTGTKVYSKLQGSATCWDLARGAMEHVQKLGYHPVMGHSYVWSSKTVPIEQAQPGDIAQFQGWAEQYRWAGNPHTAVVTKCYSKGVLSVLEQNPSPVGVGKYHPNKKSSGHVTIYRLQEKSRLRLYSEMPELWSSHSGVLIVVVAVGALTGSLALAFMWKKRRGMYVAMEQARDDATPLNGAELYPDPQSESEE